MPIDPTPIKLTTEEKIKRLVPFARRVVADTIQAKTKSRPRNEVETYLVAPKRVITILVFAARILQKLVERYVRNDPDLFVVRPDLEQETCMLIFTDFTFFSWGFFPTRHLI